MSLLRTALLIFRKDLRIEIRSFEIILTTGIFALLVALLASLAFYLDASRARALAPGESMRATVRPASISITGKTFSARLM